jgi:mRNA interferase RelE/StbE
MPLIGLTFTQSALDFLPTVPLKFRTQIIKKAKALINDPHPQGCKKLKDLETNTGDAIYRERSGDYRILYVVKNNPTHVVIIDIDNRKDVYK